MNDVRISPDGAVAGRYKLVIDGEEVLRWATLDEIERYFREQGESVQG